MDLLQQVQPLVRIGLVGARQAFQGVAERRRCAGIAFVLRRPRQVLVCSPHIQVVARSGQI